MGTSREEMEEWLLQGLTENEFLEGMNEDSLIMRKLEEN